MTHPSEYIKDLLKKHIERRASLSEIETILAALDLYDEKEIMQMLDEIDPEIDMEKYGSSLPEAPPYRILKERINRTSASKIKSPRDSPVHAAVYSCVILLFVAFLWLMNRPSPLEYSCGGVPGIAESPTGVYSCRLILGNGCSILIDSTYKGKVSQQGNTEIVRLPTGILQYKKVVSHLLDDTTQWMFNTVTTSAGDQYQVILPDGSKVRLNAASSIRFPVEFLSSERVVVLEGEAFFDVAHDKDAPFYVRVKNTVIRALGTGFNVNAYSENTVATLISGSIEVKNDDHIVRLYPGQEAIVRPELRDSAAKIVVSYTDTARVVSWKRVLRIYKNTPMKDFISDIGRWYNLEMEHTSCVPDQLISATLCYNTPVAEILRRLQVSGLHFKQEGRKIIFCTGK